MNTIRLRDALEEMNRTYPPKGEHKPFNMTYVACDEKRKRGGQFKEVRGVVVCGLSHNMNENLTIGIRPADGTGHVSAVHIHLITKFNGKEIIP